MQRLINKVEDILDLIGNFSYQGATCMLLKKENITPGFFDLKTGIAGEILQKFSNYNMKLAIIGDFKKVNSKSLRNFIHESNKTGRIIFTETIAEAITRL